MAQILSVLTEFSEGKNKKDWRISFHVTWCSRKKIFICSSHFCLSLTWKDECRVGLKKWKRRWFEKTLLNWYKKVVRFACCYKSSRKASLCFSVSSHKNEVVKKWLPSHTWYFSVNLMLEFSYCFWKMRIKWTVSKVLSGQGESKATREGTGEK